MIPVISNTVAGLTVGEGSSIAPFPSTTINDGNTYLTNTTLTIVLLDANGNPTDANGSLTLGGGTADTISKASTGVYVLTDHSTTPSFDTNQLFFESLHSVQFIASNNPTTTTFALTVNDLTEHSISDTTTTVTVSGGSPTASILAPAVTTAAPTPQPVVAAADTAAPTADTTPVPADTTVAPTETTVTPTAVTDTPPAITVTPSDTLITATEPTPIVPASTTVTPATETANPADIIVTGSVGRSGIKTVSNDSKLTIDSPRRFRGQADLSSGVIDLNKLATADSYSFLNDVISIYNNAGTVIDRLRLTHDSAAFSIEKTATGAVSIYTADDTRHAPGTLLSLHT